ncbi:MAG: recombination mediator protein UvsY [Clostridia bacterium]|nr:recombination mediator protein UvsY [Clostridia bacterium]
MAYDKFLKYKEAIEKDLKIDQFNIHNKVNDIPSLKHYWVAKLIESKIEVKQLEKKKKDLIKKVNESAEVGLKLSTASMNNVIAKSPVIAEINEQIEELELIIEYLEKAEKIFNSTTYDLKNAIELMKMESM